MCLINVLSWYCHNYCSHIIPCNSNNCPGITHRTLAIHVDLCFACWADQLYTPEMQAQARTDETFRIASMNMVAHAPPQFQMPPPASTQIMAPATVPMGAPQYIQGPGQMIPPTIRSRINQMGTQQNDLNVQLSGISSLDECGRLMLTWLERNFKYRQFSGADDGTNHVSYVVTNSRRLTITRLCCQSSSVRHRWHLSIGNGQLLIG